MDKRIYYQSGYKYQLREAYTHQLPPAVVNFITAPITTRFISVTMTGLMSFNDAYAWDGPSGPTFDTKTFMRGSLVHDGGFQLIREGATLVQNAEEIAELVRPLDHRMRAVPARYVASAPATIGDDINDERQAVIDLMGMTYVSVDELVRQSGSSQANMQMVLLEMELAGKLERGAGGKVRFAA